MRASRILFGVVLALVFVALVASVGWTAYNAGIAQGMMESGKLVVPTTTGSVVPVAPMYAPFGFHRPFGFGFGLFACLVPFFLLLFFVMLMRFAFRPRWGGPWMRGGWDPSQGDVPERVKEWHRKLHENDNPTPTTNV